MVLNPDRPSSLRECLRAHEEYIRGGGDSRGVKGINVALVYALVTNRGSVTQTRNGMLQDAARCTIVHLHASDHMIRLYVRDPSLPYEVSFQCFAPRRMANLLIGAEYPSRDIIRLENAYVRACPGSRHATTLHTQVETYQERLALKGKLGKYGFNYSIVSCPPHSPLQRVRRLGLVVY